MVSLVCECNAGDERDTPPGSPRYGAANRGFAMKSTDLVGAMREGATLKIRWKSRTIQKAKRLNVLTYPDGRTENVQWSLVSAAVKAGNIRLISRTGNTYDCEVVND